MNRGTKLSITAHFEDLEDPRIARSRRHKLMDIIVIAICGVICGAETWVDIEEFGNLRIDWLREVLELPNGVPSHDTFRRVFMLLDPKAFQKCFISWVEAIRERVKSEVVAIDGKTVRGSYDQYSGKSAIHIVSAWATSAGLVLGQVKVDDKSNEITAIPELLELLALEGCIVTIDAMGTQKGIAQRIVEKGADYVLALKKNHGNLYHAVERLFSNADNPDFKRFAQEEFTSIEKGHGRVETRRYRLVYDPNWLTYLDFDQDWTQFKTVGMVESERRIGDKVTHETRYYISSLPGNAKTFARAVRRHWGIENEVHWVLDVTFNEDRCRTRAGFADQNLVVLRHIALNLLKSEKTSKRSVNGKRLKAAWSSDYLAQVLGF